MLEEKLGDFPVNMDEGKVASYCRASDGKDILSAADVTAVEADARPESGMHDGRERTLVQISSLNDTDRVVGVPSIESRLDDAGKNDSKLSNKKDLDQGTCSVPMETEYQRTTVSKLEEVGQEDEIKRQYKNKDKRDEESSESARLTKRSKNMDLNDSSCDALKAAHLVAENTGSQQRRDFPNVDLNVAEDGDGVNHTSDKGKQMLVSGESSDQWTCLKSEKSKFDVNHSEEDENVLTSKWNDSSDSNSSSAPSNTPSDSSDAPKRRRVGKTLPSTFSFNTYITERIDALSTARANAIEVMKAKLEIEEAMLEVAKEKLEREMDWKKTKMEMKFLNTLVAKQNLTRNEEAIKLILINKYFP